MCTYISSAILTDTRKMDENPKSYTSRPCVCVCDILEYCWLNSSLHPVRPSTHRSLLFNLRSQKGCSNFHSREPTASRWKVKTCADCRYYQMNEQTLFVIFSFPLVCVRVSYREYIYIKMWMQAYTYTCTLNSMHRRSFV